MVYVTDLTHFLDDDGAPLPVELGPVARVARFFGRIAAAGSLHPVDEPVRTPLACRRRPGRRPCAGTILVLRRRDAVIEWRCSSCEDQGFISGWEETCWDLRRFDGPRPLERTIGVPIGRDGFAALLDCPTLAAEDQALLYSAELCDAGVVVRGTRDDLDLFSDAVAAEANHEGNVRRRRLLERVYDQLEVALRR